jgi:hypothetical protein
MKQIVYAVRLEQVRAYMHQHLDDELDLATLAAPAWIVPAACKRGQAPATDAWSEGEVAPSAGGEPVGRRPGDEAQGGCLGGGVPGRP